VRFVAHYERCRFRGALMIGKARSVRFVARCMLNHVFFGGSMIGMFFKSWALGLILWVLALYARALLWLLSMGARPEL